MSNNKLNLKDYIIIYLIILIVVAFIAGFFLGAKTMEEEINNLNYNLTDNEDSNNSSKDEISKFYFQIFAPTYSFNFDVYNLTALDEPVDDNRKQSFIDNGKELLSNIEIYSFKSKEINNSIVVIKENIDLLIKLLENEDIEYSAQIFNSFLTNQKYFYYSLWTWEQSFKNVKVDNNIDITSIDWNTWQESSLHKKNYIVAEILTENSIFTFNRPEDITVHIDAYLNKSDNDVSIDIVDVIKLLISSESVEDKDFLKYYNKYPEWYKNDILPEIPNFKE